MDEQLIKLVKNSLAQFKSEVPCLADRTSSERSWVFRIAYYLQKEMHKNSNEYKQLDPAALFVDVEYNRDTATDDSKRVHGSLVLPDIVIHKRTSHRRDNLICIEIKKKTNSTKDIEKTKQIIREYGYRYGLAMNVKRFLESPDELTVCSLKDASINKLIKK